MPSNKIELLRSDASYDVQRFNDQNVTLRIGHAGKALQVGSKDETRMLH